MITINLLPWREKLRRRRRQKRLLAYGVILVLIVVLLMLGYSHLRKELNALEKERVNLKATVKVLKREDQERNLVQMRDAAISARRENWRRWREEFENEQQWLTNLSDKLPAQCCIEKIRIHSEQWSMLVQCKQDDKVRSLAELIFSVPVFKQAEVYRVESDEKNAVHRIEFKGLRVIVQGIKSTANR